MFSANNSNNHMPRVARAALCATLLLSHHAGSADANTWATGKPRSSRSYTLAVAAPGGRDRPVRDFMAIRREAEEELAKREAAKKGGGKVPAVEEQAAGAISNVEEGSAEAATAGRAAVAEKLDDAVFDKTGRHHDFLALDKGNPKALAVTVGKVAVIAAVGYYGAKKVVEFAKTFIKGRKDDDAAAPAADSADTQGGDSGSSAVATTAGDDAQKEEDEAAGEAAGDDEQEDNERGSDTEEEGLRGLAAAAKASATATVEDGVDDEDEVTTEGFVTADDNEQDEQDDEIYENDYDEGEVEEGVKEAPVDTMPGEARDNMVESRDGAIGTEQEERDDEDSKEEENVEYEREFNTKEGVENGERGEDAGAGAGGKLTGLGSESSRVVEDEEVATGAGGGVAMSYV